MGIERGSPGRQKSTGPNSPANLNIELKRSASLITAPIPQPTPIKPVEQPQPQQPAVSAYKERDFKIFINADGSLSYIKTLELEAKLAKKKETTIVQHKQPVYGGGEEPTVQSITPEDVQRALVDLSWNSLSQAETEVIRQILSLEDCIAHILNPDVRYLLEVKMNPDYQERKLQKRKGHAYLAPKMSQEVMSMKFKTEDVVSGENSPQLKPKTNVALRDDSSMTYQTNLANPDAGRITQEDIDLLNGYLPIAMFLAQLANLHDTHTFLKNVAISRNPTALKLMSRLKIDELSWSDQYLRDILLTSIVTNHEQKIFELLVKKLLSNSAGGDQFDQDQKEMLPKSPRNSPSLKNQPGLLEVFFYDDTAHKLLTLLEGHEYVTDLFRIMKEELVGKNSKHLTHQKTKVKDKSPTKEIQTSQTTVGDIKKNQTVPMSQNVEAKTHLLTVAEGYLVEMIRAYVTSSSDDSVLFELLKKYGANEALIVYLMILSGEDKSLIRMCDKDESLLKDLQSLQLIQERMFTPFILFDKTSLVKVLNSELPGRKDQLVFHEICRMIGDGLEPEGLIYVLLTVHNIFWDKAKFYKFWPELESFFTLVMENNEVPLMADLNKSGSWDHQEALEADFPPEPELMKQASKINPLLAKSAQPYKKIAKVQNLPLFCIKIVYFLKKMKEQLDYKDRRISKFQHRALEFCKTYCRQASNDLMTINMFQADREGKSFLDYVFLIEDMELLNIEFFPSEISSVWDLKRHTMQTVSQFMRLNFMETLVKKFDWSVYTKTFRMPIEEGDAFQLDFAFTSVSIFVRILTDVIWTSAYIGYEVYFSLGVIDMYNQQNITDNWFLRFFEEVNIYWFILLYLRVTWILSTGIRIVLLSYAGGHNLKHALFYYATYACIAIQFLYPYIFPSEDWLLINSQMLLVNVLFLYVFYNCLSIDGVGIILRIFAKMVEVVIVFSAASIVMMIFIGYPIHVCFIDFHQLVAGQLFPQMNMFKSLYNGFLVLFEFVFGAVVFVRPYLNEDAYTYSITFIMVIFSFFGNFMLANLLMTYLSKQFQIITNKARYFTLRTQYQLAYIFNQLKLDTLVTVPFPLWIFAMPFYLLMLIKRNSFDLKVNTVLRKVNHIVNVFVPSSFAVLIMLAVRLPWRYAEITFMILANLFGSRWNVAYLLSWLVVGPLFLLKLFCQDVWTMLSILLNFSNPIRDPADEYKLSDTSRKNVIKVVRRLKAILTTHFRKFKQGADLMVGQLIIDAYLDQKLKMDPIYSKLVKAGLKGANADPLLQDDTEKEEEESDSTRLNMQYETDEETLLNHILKKFSFQENIDDDVAQAQIDLRFLHSKIHQIYTEADTHILVGFDLTATQRALKSFTDTESDADQKSAVQQVDERLNEVNHKLTLLIQELEKEDTEHLPV